jgi:uncharacterized protein
MGWETITGPRWVEPTSGGYTRRNVGSPGPFLPGPASSGGGTPVSLLTVLVRPNAARESVDWDAWRHRWVFAVRAPPLEGQANEALATFLAEVLSVPRGDVRLVHGARARQKTVEVLGLSAEEIESRLAARGGTEPRTVRRAAPSAPQVQGRGRSAADEPGTRRR